MFETIGFAVVVAGALLSGVGGLWLTLRAFQTRFLWGAAVLLLPGGVLFYVARHWQRAKRPLALMAGGLLLGVVPYGMNAWAEHFIDLGPREKMVDGELHITLTGWDKHDYSVLRQRPGTVVLQMANADVTDETLDHLAGMTDLKEIDLNETQVTDAGLKVLAQLPRLESIRLKKTAISDEGFRETLFDKDSLRELDLRGTQVSRSTVSEWKKANSERKAMR